MFSARCLSLTVRGIGDEVSNVHSPPENGYTETHRATDRGAHRDPTNACEVLNPEVPVLSPQQSDKQRVLSVFL